MAIDLSELPLRRIKPVPFRHGGVIRPALGGTATRVDHLGSRWSFEYETPPIPIEPDGRRWGALLDAAEREGAIVSIFQPGLQVGLPGNPVVAITTASGRFVPLTGCTPRYAMRAGQWVSFVVDGQRYADRVVTQAVADASGAMTIELKNLIRKPMPTGTVAEIALPKVQGSVENLDGGDFDPMRMVAWSFILTEDE